MKNILIPTDFSDNAKKATDYALTVFDDKGVKITLLNTFYIPYAAPDLIYTATDISKENSIKLFERELDRISRKFPKLKSELSTSFSVGDVVNVAQSMQDNFDMIVMGTKGASGIAEVFIGSRTATMVKTVEIPVLVVPEDAEVILPKRILFATDEALMDQKINVDALKSIAIKNKSKIEALYISDSEDNKEVIQTFIGSEVGVHLVDIPHKIKIKDGDNVEEAINKYVAENPIDLVAMITTKGNLFHSLFRKSVTKKVVMHTKMPLLVMHRFLNK
jgi:nucleotide-binding universal stress UspA family protein